MERIFQIGDICRIRQWDDMEAEFGLDASGCINCLLSFDPEMRDLCGKPFTVSRKSHREYGTVYSSLEGTEAYRVGYTQFEWHITADMLEYALEPIPIEPATIEELMFLLK